MPMLATTPDLRRPERAGPAYVKLSWIGLGGAADHKSG
jgi:hypothetical protein